MRESKLVVTDELLKHFANEYFNIKCILAVHNVAFMTFEQFVKKELKERMECVTNG